eukprot:3863377-Rhodomonas_salina.15
MRFRNATCTAPEAASPLNALCTALTQCGSRHGIPPAALRPNAMLHSPRPSTRCTSGTSFVLAVPNKSTVARASAGAVPPV